MRIVKAVSCCVVLFVVGVSALETQTSGSVLAASNFSSRSEVEHKQPLSFEVASVRVNKSDDHPSLNVDPTSGDFFISPKGLYVGKNIGLITYISFAYKLTNRQLQKLVAVTPWIAEEKFDIQARAEGAPTKDEFREMMRSLLAERFKLSAHFETKVVPLLSVVLLKPGKLGPQIRLHEEKDPICSHQEASPRSGAGSSVPQGDRYPSICGSVTRMPPTAPGRMHVGGRGITMSNFCSVMTGIGNLDRPLQDRTGLSTPVDFSLEWAQVAENVPAGSEFHPDESAPSFESALKEQLGMKLVSEKGPTAIFVLDHIERTSDLN